MIWKLTEWHEILPENEKLQKLKGRQERKMIGVKKMNWDQKMDENQKWANDNRRDDDK